LLAFVPIVGCLWDRHTNDSIPFVVVISFRYAASEERCKLNALSFFIYADCL
jgi:hypothetical protein